ncbi:uncharacterized protein I303_101430 [Kwoniella dejecticola CBS 10117]|uniref:Major facilitator superfamily (MFS) profile domain-containing protein n=1 Tax=Kwoniella dejecticola CBS 10117 TaxID=1296121 RepID=A0A1A6AHQ3_9TREE|nr:uncharacterized protein I303_01439 [Kwoniella dejecticola CBS 10117]OBR89610.1 hypothetical protein I303_01439 [Kwoniella dejecticola CBS 10117]
MPYNAFQTTALGTIIRSVSGNRLLKYHDEIDIPERYRKGGATGNNVSTKTGQSLQEKHSRPNAPYAQSSDEPRRDSQATIVDEQADQTPKAPKEKTVDSPSGSGSDDRMANNDLQAEEGTKDDPNLVTWYGDDDPENPQNWSTSYKSFVAIQMSFLTFAVYIGSSIYSSGIEGVMAQFTVSQTTALVGLTVFVIGYGIGPMLWSPVTELSNVGRMPVYVGTLFIFVALQFPTIYANNIHTLLAMRFLAGFFGSPALAVGGATMGDMFKPKHLAYAIGVWGCGAVCGPVIGPLLGGFTYQAKGWTWPLWVLVWLSGACLVMIIIFFPETSSKNILHRRMVRLRKVTGNNELKTQAMIDSSHLSGGQIISETLFRPFVLFFDPILLVYNTYLALIYGLLYIWFESFPLVYMQVHGFNPGESGTAFMGIFVGAWAACAVFCWYIHKYLEPIFDANDGMIPCPEIRLYPAPIAAVCIPIAMFGFGWSGQYESVHWIVPTIFTAFFGIGAFVLFQCIFAYFGDVFYTEMGSVLTLNDLFRASWGAAFPLFANALFKHLGIGGGNSLLGGLACLFIPAPFLFIKYGHKIREKSRFAANKS